MAATDADILALSATQDRTFIHSSAVEAPGASLGVWFNNARPGPLVERTDSPAVQRISSRRVLKAPDAE